MYDFGSFAASCCLTKLQSLLLHVLLWVADGSIHLRHHHVIHIDLRLAFCGHWKKEDGLLARSSFGPRLVLASPRQSHKHGWVLPGAVCVVVVALKPL